LSSSQWRIRTSGAAFSLSAIRHASTVPATPTPGPASAPQAPLTEPASIAAATPASPTPYNLDTITLDDVEVAAANDLVSSIPERLGFLKEIGLDYGYGPTAMIEWTLEHIHIVGGLPWWGAIAATAILMRALTFPLYLKSADQAARGAALVSLTKPLTEKMSAAQKAGDQTAVMQAWTEMGAIRKRAGLSYVSQFTPMIVQSVLGFCSFKLMRGMANLPVPGLKEGGFGWITDLTISDGYLLLPAIMAGAMHMMFRYGGETGQSNEMMNPAMRSFMLWGMPGIIFMVTGWQPGSVCIWFVASGGFAMGQAMLMQKPAVRKFFGIAPMYKPRKSEIPAKGIIDVIASSARAKTNAATGTTTASNKASLGPRSASTLSYQAPNVRTTNARGAASVPRPTFGAAGQAPTNTGVLGGLKSKYADFRAAVNENLEARNERTKREAIARAADSYEKRSKSKRDMQKRGGK
jgi:YidC/Oxa1 family membrane protein insertase